MKRIYKQGLCVWVISLFLIMAAPGQRAYAQYNDVSASYNDFYQDLANYGQWIEDPQYGYVWSPNVDGNFRPYYTNGHWVMTEYGNTWYSDYPWGWACFHYGRWTYDNYYGWLWLPGTSWGPSWVSWRYGEGFYGWAPLGPNYEYSVNFTDYNCPTNWWVFIPPQYLYAGNYYHYWYGPRDNGTIITNTTFVTNSYVNNNVTYVTGPRQTEVEHAGHQPVQVYHLANSRSLNATIHNNVVKMYHPAEIKQVAATDGQRAMPPNAVHAPQPVKPAQPLKPTEQTAATPDFRNNLPKNSGREETPGANVNETARPAPPQQRYTENPYEYDVNRPVTQPTQQPAQQQQQQMSRPQQQTPQPAPQQIQQQRPAMQQPQQPQPQQARPAPVQQQRAPVQAPAPTKQPIGGGKR